MYSKLIKKEKVKKLIHFSKDPLIHDIDVFLIDELKIEEINID